MGFLRNFLIKYFNFWCVYSNVKWNRVKTLQFKVSNSLKTARWPLVPVAMLWCHFTKLLILYYFSFCSGIRFDEKFPFCCRPTPRHLRFYFMQYHHVTSSARLRWPGTAGLISIAVNGRYTRWVCLPGLVGPRSNLCVSSHGRFSTGTNRWSQP